MSNEENQASQGVGEVAESKYHHYWLYSGLIMFQPKDVPDAAAHIPQSAVVVSDKYLFGIAELARGQRAIQAQLFNKLDPNSGDVRDIVSTGISYLGYATEQEFNPLPPTDEQVANDAAKAVLARASLADPGEPIPASKATPIDPSFEG